MQTNARVARGLRDPDPKRIPPGDGQAVGHAPARNAAGIRMRPVVNENESEIPT